MQPATPALTSGMLQEQLPVLAQEVATQLLAEGWVNPGASVLLGLPLEQWFLGTTDASALAQRLDGLAVRGPCYYHQVKVREEQTDRLVGSIETRLQAGRLVLMGVSTGLEDDAIQATLAQLQELRPPDAQDRSTLRLLACASPRMHGLWRRWPDGRGEIWIASADAPGPFRPLERVTEAELLRRLREDSTPPHGGEPFLAIGPEKLQRYRRTQTLVNERGLWPKAA